MAINKTKLCVPIDRSMALKPELYGNKAVNLARVIKAGLPVPPAFVISTESLTGNREIPLSALLPDIKELEEKTGKEFGSANNPLFLSVRSSPPFSLPGLLRTELNISNEEQLRTAIQQVRESWDGEAARISRTLYGLPDSVGTAVIIQNMVFGDLNEKSGAGVLFTCNPITGDEKMLNRFVIKAQGKSIVSRTVASSENTYRALYLLEKKFFETHKKLVELAGVLEREFQNIQEIEFVIENLNLWILQTRDAVLAPLAQVRAALSLYEKNIIDKFQLLGRLEQASKRKTYKFSISPEDIPENEEYSKKHVIGFGGYCVSPGAAEGPIAFSLEKAREFALSGKPAILLALQSPEEIQFALLSGAIAGLITQYGHEALHEAVLARTIGIPMLDHCLFTNVKIKHDSYIESKQTEAYIHEKTLYLGNHQIIEGTEVVMDGDSRCLWIKGSSPPIVENKIVDIGGLQFDYVEEERRARKLFETYSYEALFRLHDQMVRDLHAISSATEENFRLNLDAHVIHQLLFEKGKELNKSIQEIEKEILSFRPQNKEEIIFVARDQNLASALGIVEIHTSNSGFKVYFLPSMSEYVDSKSKDTINAAINARSYFVKILLQNDSIDHSKVIVPDYQEWDPMPHGHGSWFRGYSLGVIVELGFSSRLKVIEFINNLLEQISKTENL